MAPRYKSQRPSCMRAFVRRLLRRAALCFVLGVIVNLATLVGIVWFSKVPTYSVTLAPGRAVCSVNGQTHISVASLGTGIAFDDRVILEDKYIQADNKELTIDPTLGHGTHSVVIPLTTVSRYTLPLDYHQQSIEPYGKNVRVSNVMAGWPFYALGAATVSPVVSLIDGRVDGVFGIDTPKPAVRLRDPVTPRTINKPDGSQLIVVEGTMLEGVLPLHIMWTPMIMNTVFFTLLPYPLILLCIFVRGVLRTFRSACAFCGYSRAGLDGRVCPECGRNHVRSLWAYILRIVV